MGLFRDRTIKNAVAAVLEERIAVAQEAYDDNVLEFDAVLEDEIAEAKARNRAAKEARAVDLASEVLGK